MESPKGFKGGHDDIYIWGGKGGRTPPNENSKMQNREKKTAHVFFVWVKRENGGGDMHAYVDPYPLEVSQSMVCIACSYIPLFELHVIFLVSCVFVQGGVNSYIFVNG